MMDVIPYPPGLPPPIDQNFGFELPAMKQESQMVSGYTRMRRRFGAPPPTYTFNFWFTSEQFSIFRSYFHYDLRSGTRTTAVPLLVPEDKNNITLREGRFKGNYSQPRIPSGEYDSWMVQCQFILNQDTILPYDEYIDFYFNGDAKAFTDSLRNAVQQWPKLPGQAGYPP